MLSRITAHWGGARVLRLVLGVVFILAAVLGNEPWAWIPGIVLLMQAGLNVGCGCATSCSTPVANHKAELGVQEVEYEEVK